MKIVADIDIPFLRGALEPYADVAYLRGREISPRDVADARALVVRTRTRCDAALLDGSQVETICTATVGFDHIDMEYCARRGIVVATSAGGNARAVLQWVAAVLAHIYKGKSPEGRTLGVVGVGNVGSLVARYAAAWGFRVLCCDPPRQRGEGRAERGERASRRAAQALAVPSASPADGFVSLEELAPQCDIISFHTPLTVGGEDNTFHLADRRFFAQLKRGAVVINTSRGEVVESGALLEALEAGRCAYAIDTWECEPHVDHALVGAALIATPHIAGYSQQGKAMTVAMAVRALGRRYGWPLGEWYPPEGPPRVAGRPIGWEEMCRTIGGHFDIEALSRRFKGDPAAFEQMRDSYVYRSEYF